VQNRAIAARIGKRDDAARTLSAQARTLASGEQRARLSLWEASLLNHAVVELAQKKRTDEARRLGLSALELLVGESAHPLTHALQQNVAQLTLQLAQDALDLHQNDDAQRWFVEATRISTSESPIRSDVEGRLAASHGEDCSALNTPRARGRCATDAAQRALDRGDADGALSTLAPVVVASHTDANSRAMAVELQIVAWVARGNRALQENRCDDAVAAFRAAEDAEHAYRGKRILRLSKKDVALCHYNVGVGFANAGNRDDALRAFDRSLAIAPTAEAKRGKSLVSSPQKP
jgi:tetratricopeptide (TPR) repeat protein